MSLVLDLSSIQHIMVPIHITQIVVAVFISWLSFRFFRLTKPLKVFYFFYFAMVMFIGSAAFYLQAFFTDATSGTTYHIASQSALIATLAALGVIFWSIYRGMKSGTT
ncbi:MAG: hypothetical protein OXR66_00090 [Candidatus Woesearchaeota archaeon]|nr:hypothetical protein [Candidatus Woesearchaeota archaeon]